MKKKYTREKSLVLLPVMRLGILILSFFSTRMIIENYQITGYSHYAIIMSLYSINALLDLGLGNQIINRLSQENRESNQDNSLIKKVTFHSTIIALFLSTILGLTVIIIQTLFSFSMIVTELEYIVALYVGIILTSGGRIYAKSLLGKQFNIRYGLFDLSASFISYAVTIIAASLRMPLVIIIVAQTSIVGICGLIMVIRLKGESQSKFSPGIKRVTVILQDIKDSRNLAVLQTLNLVSFQLDTYLISLFCTSREVAEYAITWRVFSTVYVLTSSYMTPIWARSSQLYSEGQLPEIQILLVANLKKCAGVGLIASVLIIILKSFIFDLFTGSLLIPSYKMLLTCGLFLTIYLLALPLALIMNAIDTGKVNLLVSSISAALNIFVTLVLLKITHSNVAGLIGSSSALFFFYCIPTFLFLKKKLF
jgi:O-antigen/teichoic acid export membrane protein